LFSVLDLLQNYHVETIEIGVQSTDPDVLVQSGRPCSHEIIERSISLIRKIGFRLGIQIMPGLPGDDSIKFRKTVSHTLLWQPDFVRIYPALVIRGTKLHEMYLKGDYLLGIWRRP